MKMAQASVSAAGVSRTRQNATLALHRSRLASQGREFAMRSKTIRRWVLTVWAVTLSAVYGFVVSPSIAVAGTACYEAAGDACDDACNELSSSCEFGSIEYIHCLGNDLKWRGTCLNSEEVDGYVECYDEPCVH